MTHCTSFLVDPKYSKSPKGTQFLSPNLSVPDQEKFIKFGFGEAIPPRFSCIHEAIAYESARNPMAIAIMHNKRTLSYQELENRAEYLADYMYLSGVRANDKVGIFLERSIEMIIGIYAVLKLGASYVPQDARITKPTTLDYIAQQCEIKCILSLRKFKPAINTSMGREVIYLDELSFEGELPQRTIEKNSADNPCFILFTSGTTGSPNGVVVTHKNVSNILQTSPGNLNICSGTLVGQILSISFDMAAWEILGTLSNGGTLVIRGSSIQETAEKVNVIISTPSILSSIDIEKCSKTRTVIVAGEPCPRALADKWSYKCEFINSCGPTETTIINTAANHFVDKTELTIGKPTPNNSVYILDDDLNPLPIGEVGEMWAGGDGVTSGYIGNSQLTEDRYRPDPFIGGNARMFRTRDLGKWNEKGELIHLGRTDDQVKIRGCRVELGGVTTIIESVKGCEQAVTIKLDDKNLVSFVSPKHAPLDRALKALEKNLPYYAVPKKIIAIDSVPRTSRGKADHRKLFEIANKKFLADIQENSHENT